MERAQTKQKHYYDQKRKQTNFQVGDVEWVRAHPLAKADDGFMAKLSAKWKGPAKIEKCLGPVNYVVSFLDDPTHVDTFHVQNLKPCHGYVKPSSEGRDM